MITLRRDDVAVAAAQATRLAAARAEAIRAVNAQIGRLRQGTITVIPGQEMIYQAKEAEARAWVAGEPGAYPLLMAEVGITAPDADQLAQVWLNMGALWREAAAELEALRLSTGAAIAAASSQAEVDGILINLGIT